GAAFLPGTMARLIPADEKTDSRRLRLRQENTEATLTAWIVVAADGLGGGLLAQEPGHRVRISRAARIGAGTVVETPPPFFEPGTIYMACGEAGYVGLVRLEDGQLDLAAALDPAPVRRHGLATVTAEVLARTGWPALSSLERLEWRGTPALTRQAHRPAGQRY